MDVACPTCGSDNLRYSRVQTVSERLRSFTGVHPLRCRECKTRFSSRLWSPGDWRYARCPRCFRMDLNTWSREHYSASGSIAVKLSFGARRYRCEACRCNFASFRPRKRRYERRTRPAPAED